MLRRLRIRTGHWPARGPAEIRLTRDEDIEEDLGHEYKPTKTFCNIFAVICSLIFVIFLVITGICQFVQFVKDTVASIRGGRF